MMKALLLALLPLAGCAAGNHTPEQNAQFQQNFMQGLSTLSNARQQPTYYQAPMPQPTRTICRNSFGAVVCDSN